MNTGRKKNMNKQTNTKKFLQLTFNCYSCDGSELRHLFFFAKNERIIHDCESRYGSAGIDRKFYSNPLFCSLLKNCNSSKDYPCTSSRGFDIGRAWDARIRVIGIETRPLFDKIVDVLHRPVPWVVLCIAVYFIGTLLLFASNDSRYRGLFPEEYIVGKVWIHPKK